MHLNELGQPDIRKLLILHGCTDLIQCKGIIQRLDSEPLNDKGTIFALSYKILGSELTCHFYVDERLASNIDHNRWIKDEICNLVSTHNSNTLPFFINGRLGCRQRRIQYHRW